MAPCVFMFALQKEWYAIQSHYTWQPSEIFSKKKKNFVLHPPQHTSNPLYACITGMGKTRAASMTQYIIDQIAPNIIINLGIAGGVDTHYPLGAMVPIASCLHHDQNPPSGTPRIFNADQRVLDAILSDTTTAEALAAPGLCLTGEFPVLRKKKRNHLAERFGTACIDMELAAIAQTCDMNSISWCSCKIISDTPAFSGIRMLQQHWSMFQQQLLHAFGSIKNSLENQTSFCS